MSWEDHPRVRLRPRPPRKSSPSLRIRMSYREVRTREKTRVVEENYPREVVEINPWEDLHPKRPEDLLHLAKISMLWQCLQDPTFMPNGNV